MDENVTIGSMKQIVKDFCEARDWDQFHNPKDWLLEYQQKPTSCWIYSDFRPKGR